MSQCECDCATDAEAEVHVKRCKSKELGLKKEGNDELVVPCANGLLKQEGLNC